MTRRAEVWPCCNPGVPYPEGHACVTGFWDCPSCREPHMVEMDALPRVGKCDECGFTGDVVVMADWFGGEPSYAKREGGVDAWGASRL